MPTHINLGDLAVPVGHYTKENQQTKKRYRNIGTLMKTTHGDGGESYWVKMNAEILQPSLYALVRAESMQKGDDAFVAAVFAPRTEKAASAASEPEPAEDDGNPY